MRNMVDTNMVEEIEGGNLFDQIDDLLEFPNDDVDFGSGEVDCSAFPPVWTEESSGFSSGHSQSASDLSAELSVPYEDIVQLEWLSTFVEDSFSGGGGLTLDKTYTTSSDNKDSFQTQFQTSSPISVLSLTHEKRARSKRPRPATFTPRAPFELILPTSSSISRAFSQPSPVGSSESGNFPDHQKKKRKIIKNLPLSNVSDGTSYDQSENPKAGAPVRKCSHCEITKTPQWRTGPTGPKSLCNACGVRYKSGRLYPEYRPAASPTFIPSLHSNSHKKVLEMRGCVTVASPSRKLELVSKSHLVEPHM